MNKNLNSSNTNNNNNNNSNSNNNTDSSSKIIMTTIYSNTNRESTTYPNLVVPLLGR